MNIIKLSPILFFGFISLFSFFLYSLKISDRLDLGFPYEVFFIGFISFFLGYIPLIILKIRYRNREASLKKINYLSIIGIVSTISLLITHLLISGLPPFFQIFSFETASYAKYGITGLLGFFKAFIFASSFLIFQTYFTNGHITIHSKIFLISALLFGLIMMQRQIIFILIVPMIITYIQRSNYSFILKIGIGLFGLILFGILGDLRTPVQVFEQVSQINADSFIYDTKLHWFYVYYTIPVENLANIIVGDFSCQCLSPILKPFVPKVLYNYFGLELQRFDKPFQVVKGINTSTLYGPAYLAYKYTGVSVILFIYGLFYSIFFSKMNYENHSVFLNFLNMCLILSPMIDLLWRISILIVPLFYIILYKLTRK